MCFRFSSSLQPLLFHGWSEHLSPSCHSFAVSYPWSVSSFPSVCSAGILWYEDSYRYLGEANECRRMWSQPSLFTDHLVFRSQERQCEQETSRQLLSCVDKTVQAKFGFPTPSSVRGSSCQRLSMHCQSQNISRCCGSPAPWSS